MSDCLIHVQLLSPIFVSELPLRLLLNVLGYSRKPSLVFTLSNEPTSKLICTVALTELVYHNFKIIDGTAKILKILLHFHFVK